MKTKAIILIGTSVSLAAAFGLHEILDHKKDQARVKSERLAVCATEGLDAEGCRDLVYAKVDSDVSDNSLGYTAVFTQDAITAESERLAGEAEPSISDWGGPIVVFALGSLVSVMQAAQATNAIRPSKKQ